MSRDCNYAHATPATVSRGLPRRREPDETSAIPKTQTRSTDTEEHMQTSNESDRQTRDVERCPRYNERIECVFESPEGQLRRLTVSGPNFVASNTRRATSPGESLSRSLFRQTAAALGLLHKARDLEDATPGCPADGTQWADFGSSTAQTIPKFQRKFLYVYPEGNLSFAEVQESGAAPSTSSDSCPALSQENPNRGRRKKMLSSNLMDADAVEPPEQTSSNTHSPQPTTQPPCGSNPVFHDSSLCPELRISILSRLSTTSREQSPYRYSPSRPLGIITIRRIGDLASLFLGYVLTISIINSHHPDDGWLMDLPLMKLLPPSFTHPSQLVMVLQFISWSLIGIFHLLQSPRYWPECGFIANAVSVAVGGWFGLRAMLDSLIMTAFISLLVVKAIEWRSENRTPSAGVILPFAEQDRKY